VRLFSTITTIRVLRPLLLLVSVFLGGQTVQAQPTLSAATASLSETLDNRQSSYLLMSPATRAMQDDEALNPATFWVLDGQTLWTTPTGKKNISCAQCHGDAAVSMKGVAASFPKMVHKTLLSLEGQINMCRQNKQEAAPFALESKPLLSMASYLGNVSKGMPITVERTASNAVDLDAGQRLFEQRIGQLNLSCAQCHAERAGLKLGGNLIPEAHPNGYPIYRLEWQTVGSLQRRLRNCMTGVRAEPYALGAQELVQLELFLMWRARGMPLETPGVRP
jgi:sulfur-oxidizing protein SoxA